MSEMRLQGPAVSDKENGEKGVKYDQGKPDMSLIPYDPVKEIAKVFMFGQKKYGRWNYLNGMKWSRIIGAMERHIGKFKNREDFDDESKLLALAHIGCCVIILLMYQIFGLGEDDRAPKMERQLCEPDNIPK
jgi:hypothetical protein